MDLSLYKPTELESWIYQKYRSYGIHYASDLEDIDLVASIFNTMVYTTKDETRIVWDDDFGMILLHAYYAKEIKRASFFHELGHFLRHIGCQNKLPKSFMELQESQASHFQLYAAMPIYMIQEIIHDVYSYAALEKVLAEEFILPIPFVQKRIDQISRRIYIGQQEKEWRERDTDTSHITPEYVKLRQQEIERQRIARFGT
ncbi:ImmA/IrrE family metallo-endopeptidase [Paenibacillus sp. UNC451MF]|uniref:ImmA/IrrE family metallo-endopeptidase n=1 Tax=Paenibacillus sp. UNC451MF TaxID=1449063 RepID=UPI0004921117|nr:ImmA/IrrE family metallo-endopeptidase [Paenibacillus sp. UNC451MF]